MTTSPCQPRIILRPLLCLVLFCLLVACAAPAAPATAPTEAAAEPTATLVPLTRRVASVCLVTDQGNISDGTYNELAYTGMNQASQEFGLVDHYIENTTVENFEPNIDSCLQEDYQVVITLGPLISPHALEAAKNNPETRFIGIDHFFDEAPPPNMAIIQYREDQGGFLAGALACMMTESDIVAGVYGIEIPPLKRFRNGFENGCRYVNPDAQMLGIYMESFTDPSGGGAKAKEFIEQGADVLFGAAGPTGSGAIREAADKGIWVIGVDQDEYKTTFLEGNMPGAERLLSSAVKRVDLGVYQQLQALAEPGTIPWGGGGYYTLDAANRGIDYAPFHETEEAVPPAVKERLEEIRLALADGTLKTGVDFATGDVLDAEVPEAVPFKGE